ncbi:MAG: twin-arginine translocation signal domain-containing protein [Pseudomonadota bacterium]
MAKNKRKAQQAHRKAAAQAEMAGQGNRRRFLKHVRTGAILMAVLGGGAWASQSYFSDLKHEYDLTRIGNGTPTVVQIHDPQCPICASLQREARIAMDEFSVDQLQYVVADIKMTKGRDFAAAHGVGHVTLLLFDGDGQRRGVLQGVRQSDELKRAFDQLVDAARS